MVESTLMVTVESGAWVAVATAALGVVYPRAGFLIALLVALNYALGRIVVGP